MTVSLATIATPCGRVSVADGDLIVIRSDEFGPEEFHRLAAQLTAAVDALGVSAKAIVVTSNVQIETLGEEQMARLGWFRQVPSVHAR